LVFILLPPPFRFPPPPPVGTDAGPDRRRRRSGRTGPVSDDHTPPPPPVKYQKKNNRCNTSSLKTHRKKDMYTQRGRMPLSQSRLYWYLETFCREVIKDHDEENTLDNGLSGLMDLYLILTTCTKKNG
jgi:hypothetical protein